MSLIDYGYGTHPGLIRECNEDRCLVEPELGLWAIADGMGGHEAGEVASGIVVRELPGYIRQGMVLSEAILAVHRSIQTAAERGEGGTDMGSTVVAVKFDDFHFEIAWVGDSRAYLWNGGFCQLTRDHSYVQLLLEAGLIERSEMATHPSRNVISQALGGLQPDEIKVEGVAGELGSGESLLLCSDGLSGEVSDREIAVILTVSTDNQIRADQLIEAALVAGGNDNISVIVLSRR